MRFLIDENLPVALAGWLTGHGHQAEHTSALGLNSTPDLDIAHHALQTNAVIVTKDSDYLSFAPGRRKPDVVHLDVGNMSTVAPLALCASVWPNVTDQIDAGAASVKVTRDAGRVS